MNNTIQKTLLLSLLFITTTSYIIRPGHIYLDEPTDSFGGEDLNNIANNHDFNALSPEEKIFFLKAIRSSSKNIRKIGIRSSHIYLEEMERWSPWEDEINHLRQIYLKRMREKNNDRKGILKSENK